MKISVAMATYNGAKYLRELLDSLASQVVLPYELVVCDDGSTDETLAIVREFAKSAPFSVLIHQNEITLGYGENFLQAAGLCTGDWIAFCDQDDVWLPEKLESCLRYIGSGVTMVYHSADVVDSDLKPLTGYSFQTGNTKRLARNGFPPWQSIAGFTIIFDAKLPFFKENSCRPCDPYRPTVRFAHDQWIPFLATIFGEIVFISDRLVLYRQHGSNIMSALPFRTKSWGLHGEMRTQSNDFLALSNFSAERAAFLYSLIERSGKHIEAIKDAYYRHICHTRFIYLRHAFYGEESFLKRASVFGSLIYGFGYGSTQSGGLGAKALIKDVFNLLRAK